MKKILYYITIISVALMAHACEGIETPVLDQGSQPNATFTGEMQKINVDDSDNGKFTITMNRGNAAEEVSIPLNLTIDAAVPAEIGFKLVSASAQFAKGEYTTEVTVEFNTEAMAYYTEYRLVLEVADETLGPLYPTGVGSTKLDVQRVYTPIGTGTFDSQLFGEGWLQDVVLLSEDADGNKKYMLPDLYVLGYHIYFTVNADHTEFEFMNEDFDPADLQPIGYIDGADGMLYFYVAGYTLKDKELSLDTYFYILNQGSYKPKYRSTEVLTLPDEFFE